MSLQGGDPEKWKEGSTSCEIEIRNLETLLWVETTEQLPGIDLKDDSTEYIAMVKKFY